MKAFIVKMIGYDVQIDEDEIPKIVSGLSKGSVIVLKRGIINPSGFSGIIEDRNRDKERETDTTGSYTGKVLVAPLKDLFPDLREKLEQLSSQKRLT